MIVLLFLPYPIQAATGINKQINFQGKTVNSDGTNVANGDYDFEFKIYTVASGGTAIWTETWDSGTSQVTVTDGVFRVALGTHTAFPGSVDFNTDNIYLSVNFNSDGEMTPRIRFTAVPYAFNAEKVAGLTVTNTTGTLTIPDAKTISFADAFTTSGAFALTLTTTAATDITLPTTGTLTTLAGTETLTNKTITASGLIIAQAGLTVEGNVGIGTTSPVTRLTIGGGAQSPEITIYGRDSSGRTSFLDDDYAFIGTSAHTTGAYPFSSKGNLILQSSAHADRDIVFVAGDTPSIAVVIAGNGNVGIGTTNPGAQLELGGATMIADSNTIDFSDVADGYALTFDTGTNTWAGEAVAGGDASYGSSASSPDDAVYVNDDGNVGIGTTSPGEKLEVVGNIISKGTSWTSRTGAANKSWRSVTYGNGLFVAVADTGTDRLMTSPDGINWTLRTPAADNNWQSVAYGNGTFVAVPSTGAGTDVMTSPNGITWTLRTSAAADRWRSVTYGNGLFVAVSYDGTVMTSPNGITWTSQTAAAANNWLSVIYGNGLFVAVATNGTGNRVMTSPNGEDWTSQTSAADNGWDSVTYGNGMFVAIAYPGTIPVMTSPDGITWTLRTAPTDARWAAVTYGNGIFVAVSYFQTYRAMTSGKPELNPLAHNNIYQGGMSIYGNVGIGMSPGVQLDLSTDSARKLTTNTWTIGSDARIKTDVQSIGDALDIISEIRPVKFHFTQEFLSANPSVNDVDYYHFIAQEYQEVFPSSVTETDGLLYLNSSNMIPYAIAGIKALDQEMALAIQEQQLQIDEITGLITAQAGLTFENSGPVIDFVSGTDGNTFIAKIPQKATTETCASATAEGLIFQNSGGTQVGHICIDGPTSATPNKLHFYAGQFSTNSTDLAESYSDHQGNLEPGDVVAFDLKHPGPSVTKTSQPYQSTLMGVVSQSPGLLLTDISEQGKTSLINPKPVALAGRVLANVSTENGAIKTGDLLTSSSISGVAMKANLGKGPTIGIALEDFNGVGIGKVLISINSDSLLAIQSPTPSPTPQNLDTVTQEQEAAVQTDITSRIMELLETWGVTLKDQVVNATAMLIDNLTVREMRVSNDSPASLIGEAVIPSDSTEVTVANESLTQRSKIFVTFKGKPQEVSWSVTEIKDNEYFKIAIAEPLLDDLYLDYWIINTTTDPEIDWTKVGGQPLPILTPTPSQTVSPTVSPVASPSATPTTQINE